MPHEYSKQRLKVFSNIRSVITVILLLVNYLVLPAQILPSKEYQVKAIFLFNFAQFVEWPASSFSTDQAPLVIGVLGENPFGSYLEETVNGEKVNGHPLIVQYYKSPDEIKTCHILFINLNGTNKQQQAVAGLKGKNILTVSDASDSFLQSGGITRLFTKNNKIQVEINLQASKETNMVISSKLLKLAEIFVPGKRD